MPPPYPPSQKKRGMLPRSSSAQMEGCAEEDGDSRIHSEVKRLFSPFLSVSDPLLSPVRFGPVGSGPARLGPGSAGTGDCSAGRRGPSKSRTPP